MKKVKFEGKLSLNKETVAKLNDMQMEHIKGGEVDALHSRILCLSSNDSTRKKCCLPGTTSMLGGSCNQ